MGHFTAGFFGERAAMVNRFSHTPLLALWRAIAPEPLADDQRVVIRALLIRIAFLAVLLSGGLIVIGALNRMWVTTVAAALTGSIAGAILALARRGHLTLCRLLMPACAFGLITALIVTNDGLYDEGVLAYPFILVLAGLFMGRRGIRLYAVLVLAALNLIGLAEIAGVLVNAFSAFTHFERLILLDVFAGFTAVLLDLTIENLNQSLAQTRQLCQQVQHELAQRIQAERDMRQAKEDADIANQGKINFLRSVSHELRTPLNQILGFAQILQLQPAGAPTAKHAEYVGYILAAGQRLLALVEDVLLLSHLEMDEHPVRRQSLRLKPFLESSLRLVRGKDFKRRLTLTVTLPPELEEADIVADQHDLKQIVFQLLSNAVKFTPDGGIIRLGAERQGDYIVIQVSDTGIGIAPADQEKIFRKFYQTQGGLTDKTPGTGLGLPIARRLAELHGGALRVQSAGPGQGSCFSVMLPLTPASPPQGA